MRLNGLLRHALLKLIAPSLLACAAISAHAAYPEQTITLIAPFPAGGAADVIARLLAKELGDKLGKSVVVENKSGAGSTIGGSYVANAKPDGYTILLGSNSTFVLNPALMDKMPYDSSVAFDPIGKIGTLGLVLIVHPSVPAKNVAELVALIKANPEQIQLFEKSTEEMQEYVIKTRPDLIGKIPHLRASQPSYLADGEREIKPLLVRIADDRQLQQVVLHRNRRDARQDVILIQ